MLKCFCIFWVTNSDYWNQIFHKNRKSDKSSKRYSRCSLKVKSNLITIQCGILEHWFWFIRQKSTSNASTKKFAIENSTRSFFPIWIFVLFCGDFNWKINAKPGKKFCNQANKCPKLIFDVNDQIFGSVTVIRKTKLIC